MEKYYHKRFCINCGKLFKFRIYYRFQDQKFIINRYEFYCCEKCKNEDKNKLESLRRKLRNNIKWNEVLHIRK